jgi:hypothetical protein
VSGPFIRIVNRDLAFISLSPPGTPGFIPPPEGEYVPSPALVEAVTEYLASQGSAPEEPTQAPAPEGLANTPTGDPEWLAPSPTPTLLLEATAVVSPRPVRPFSIRVMTPEWERQENEDRARLRRDRLQGLYRSTRDLLPQTNWYPGQLEETRPFSDIETGVWEDARPTGRAMGGRFAYRIRR